MQMEYAQGHTMTLRIACRVSGDIVRFILDPDRDGAFHQWRVKEDLDLELGLNFVIQVYVGTSDHMKFTGTGCIHQCNICVHNT